MKNICIHDSYKVYSHKIHLSDPPRIRWICSNCGFHGSLVLAANSVGGLPTYEELCKKFGVEQGE